MEEVIGCSCADGMSQGDWQSHIVEAMRIDEHKKGLALAWSGTGHLKHGGAK